MFGRLRYEFLSQFVASLCVALLLVVTLVVPKTAGAATNGSPLAGGLAKLATPAVATKSAHAQAEAIGLPVEGAGSLVREGERVVVEAGFEAGALSRVEALKAAGAKILLASRRYQAVALSIKPGDLEAIAAVPGVSVIKPSLQPALDAEGGGTTASDGSSGSCEGGSVISQGVAQLNVPAAREAFGVDGAGVTVGVLSDSFDSATKSIEGKAIASRAAEDEETNDLPGLENSCTGQQVPVDVVAEAPSADSSELTDEGRAMLQVVHDVAPEAELAFATAWSTELQFAHNIELLADPVADGGAGAEVIVDDVSYYTEPFFQEGPVANAIRRVTEAGVTYLTAAGNDNLIEAGSGRDIASWERSKFKDTPCPSALASRTKEADADCMNFSPDGSDPTLGITVGAHSELLVDLQWAEPWGGTESDLNAYLLSSSGQLIKSGSYVSYGLFGEPFEFLAWENSGSAKEVQLVVDRCIHNCDSAASVTAHPRMKLALVENGYEVSRIEYPESDAEAGILVGPTIFGHAGSADAITLGAINYAESSAEPKEPEEYSSRGPVAHYFGPVDDSTPADKLEPGEAIAKPNLIATDCAATTFFAEINKKTGKYEFCGTSEAAPHAAGVAALMKSLDPLASPKGIREAMEESATPFTVVTSCEAVGAGLLDADGALAALESAESVAATSGGGVACLAELDPEEVGGGEEEKEKEEATSTAAPVVTITKGPKSLGNESRPTFEFSATTSASFACQVDGGTPQACTSPYRVPTLGDGSHGFVVTATDAQGRSGTSAIYSFTVDTKAPVTKISGHPSKVVKTRKKSVVARFRLKANQSPVTFYCRFDREPLRVCGKRPHYRAEVGSHVLKVRAKDQAGNLATKATVFRFRVKELPRARSSR
ncbi:MAG: S8 family serine peptidase [Solirubrobacterales bacterium]